MLLKSGDSPANPNNINRSRIYAMLFFTDGATTSNGISKGPGSIFSHLNISDILQFDQNEKLTRMLIWIIHGILNTDNIPQNNFKFYREIKKTGKFFLWEFKDKYHNNIVSSHSIEALPKQLFK